MAKSARNQRNQSAGPRRATANHSLSAEVPRDEIREKVEEIIPPEIVATKRGEVVDRVVRIVAGFCGPIPLPSLLAEYEATCPGLADRITKMAEKAQDRLEDRKDKLLEYEYRDRKLGLCLGFSALALLIVSGVIISIYGSIYVGAGLLSAAAIGAAITPFINGRKKIPQMPSKVTKKPAAKSGE